MKGLAANSELDFSRGRSLRQLRVRVDQRDNGPEREAQLWKSAQFRIP